MKNLLFLALLLLSFAACNKAQPLQDNEFDLELATELGADDYGMKNYILVILETGQAQIEEEALRDSLFAGHFANMNRMSDDGMLLVAGPLGDNNLNYRGIFILNTTSLQEAESQLLQDPTISSGIFEPVLIPWYGSAALSEYLKVHERIQKKRF